MGSPAGAGGRRRDGPETSRYPARGGPEAGGGEAAAVRTWKGTGGGEGPAPGRRTRGGRRGRERARTGPVPPGLGLGLCRCGHDPPCRPRGPGALQTEGSRGPRGRGTLTPGGHALSGDSDPLGEETSPVPGEGGRWGEGAFLSFKGQCSVGYRHITRGSPPSPRAEDTEAQARGQRDAAQGTVSRWESPLLRSPPPAVRLSQGDRAPPGSTLPLGPSERPGRRLT